MTTFVTISESIVFEELDLISTIFAYNIENIGRCPKSGVLPGALQCGHGFLFFFSAWMRFA